jgi:hypothetical protein
VARATEWLCERWGAAAVGRKLSAVGKSACALSHSHSHSPTRARTRRRERAGDGGGNLRRRAENTVNRDCLCGVDSELQRAWERILQWVELFGLNVTACRVWLIQPHLHAHRRSGPPSPTRHLNNTTCIECDISSTNYTPLPSPPKYARMSATTTSGCSHAAISAASLCRFTQSTRHHAEPHMAGDGLPVSACLRKLLMPNGTGQ